MKMYITTITITPLLLLLALIRSSFGDDITIVSEGDFTDFVSKVNSRKTNYLGTTVYLGSDITLSGSIDPIGNENINQFLGVFDGQGHVISELKTNSSFQYAGLFGYSKGLTIRDVVLGDSCSITSSFKSSSSDQGYVGGIIGRCLAISGECNIENSVNMADVTFSGSISGDSNLYIGGITGELYSSSSYDPYMKNCVNYGSVTHSGTVGNYTGLGGLVGLSSGSSLTHNNYIQNCLNYGAITHNGTSANLYIGGIVGNDYSCTYIENCVSAGKISTQTTAKKDNYIGSIMGYVNSNVYTNYCYFTSDANVNSIYGYAESTPTTTETPDSPTDVNTDLVSKLNNIATSCSWDNWFMLHLNGGNINNLTQDPLIGIQGHIPNPAKEGNSFLFWCKDAECTKEFDPETESVSGITDLYAAWTPNNYTVTYDFDNGTTMNATFTYNTEIIYPDVKKDGYTFSQWDNYHKVMPASDITVTAQWTPNNYTVTFDANGGNVSKTSKTVTFNETYDELPEPERAEYIFIGWFTNETDGTEVTNETTVTTPYNHTLYAHWEEVTAQVEIVFNTKDLTREDVDKLIKKYTEAGFTIVKYENGSEGIRVIIGFVGKESAENFIASIKESSETTNMIKRIGFVIDDPGSFSAMVYPLPLFNALFL